MKLKAQRASIEFTYEFADGTEAKFKYFEPSTEIIDKTVELSDADNKTKMEFTKQTLNDLIVGDEELKEKMFEELLTIGNIYEFNAALNDELGKQKQKKRKG